MSDIERILVSGTDDQIAEFASLVKPWAHPIIEQGQTMCFTAIEACMKEVLQAAKLVGVTVQRRETQAKQEPYWTVVVQGKAKPWKKEEK